MLLPLLPLVFSASVLEVVRSRPINLAVHLRILHFFLIFCKRIAITCDKYRCQLATHHVYVRQHTLHVYAVKRLLFLQPCRAYQVQQHFYNLVGHVKFSNFWSAPRTWDRR